MSDSGPPCRGPFLASGCGEGFKGISEIEVIRLFFMSSLCSPGFRAVESEGGEDDCPVDFPHGFKANCSPLADILPQSPKGSSCLDDSVVDHGIKVGVAGECAAQVGNGLYRLKGLWGLSVHRCFQPFYSADGETKVVAG